MQQLLGLSFPNFYLLTCISTLINIHMVNSVSDTPHTNDAINNTAASSLDPIDRVKFCNQTYLSVYTTFVIVGSASYDYTIIY